MAIAASIQERDPEANIKSLVGKIVIGRRGRAPFVEVEVDEVVRMEGSASVSGVFEDGTVLEIPSWVDRTDVVGEHLYYNAALVGKVTEYIPPTYGTEPEDPSVNITLTDARFRLDRSVGAMSLSGETVTVRFNTVFGTAPAYRQAVPGYTITYRINTTHEAGKQLIARSQYLAQYNSGAALLEQLGLTVEPAALDTAVKALMAAGKDYDHFMGVEAERIESERRNGEHDWLGVKLLPSGGTK